VASIELGGATSSLALAYNAGARYQQPDEGGLVHHLRNLFGNDSAKYLSVKLLWQLGSSGGNLNAIATKDLLGVQTTVNRDNSPVAISLLGEFSRPALKPWDVVDGNETLSSDLHYQQPYDIVLELLHKAAYRNGPLAVPILAHPFEIGKVNHKQLQNYAASRLVTGSAVLVGVNVKHEDLLTYATHQGVIPESRATPAKESPYKGGDTRLSGPTNVSHVIVAGEGASLGDVKGMAVQHVLAALIGKQTGLKFSNLPGNSVVGAAIQTAANHRPVGIGAVNVSHSDSGLIGVYVATDGQYADPIVHAAADGLKALAGSLDAAVVDKAKSDAKLEALLRYEQPDELVLDHAAQVLAQGEIVPPKDLADQIQKVTAEDVKKAAQTLVKKLSVAAYGRINQVPYADQL